MAARTFMSMTPGMLTSLFNVLGCTVGPRDDRFGGVRVTYLDDGRIEGVQVVPSQLSKECQPALGVLGVLTLAAPSQIVRQGEGQWLLLPMDAAAIACADQPRSASPDAPVRIGELHVTPPTKIRHVNPVYPESAERTGVQGVVVLQTEISETGCVRRSNVIRSVPGLDLAALRAVSSWTFTPTRVGSQAVPVFMTVTVNFSLR